MRRRSCSGRRNGGSKLTTGASHVDFPHLFDYVVKARGKLLEWVRSQPPSVYTQEFPIGLRSIRTTLLHTAAAEWTYVQRLGGRDVTLTDSPFTPQRLPHLEPFVSAWALHEPVTRAAFVNLGDPGRPVEFTSRVTAPPMRARTTAAGIAVQILLHEVHHRAQVMAMLRQAGVAAENLDYSVLMFDRSPLPDSPRASGRGDSR